MQKAFTIQRWILFLLPFAALAYALNLLIQANTSESGGLGALVVSGIFSTIIIFLLIPLLLLGILQLVTWNHRPVLAWNLHVSALILLAGSLFQFASNWLLIVSSTLVITAFIVAFQARKTFSGGFKSWLGPIVSLVIVVGLLSYFRTLLPGKEGQVGGTLSDSRGVPIDGKLSGDTSNGRIVALTMDLPVTLHPAPGIGYALWIKESDLLHHDHYVFMSDNFTCTSTDGQKIYLGYISGPVNGPCEIQAGSLGSPQSFPLSDSLIVSQEKLIPNSSDAALQQDTGLPSFVIIGDKPSQTMFIGNFTKVAPSPGS